MTSCEFGYYREVQRMCDAQTQTCRTEFGCSLYTTLEFLVETFGVALLILTGIGAFCALGHFADTMSMIPRTLHPPYYDLFVLIAFSVGIWVILNIYWWSMLM